MEEIEKKDEAVQTLQSMPVYANDEIVELADKAERRITAYNKIKVLALRAAYNPTDWVDMGGKPYLQSTGCEKIGGLFGISIHDIKGPFFEYEEDGHYIVRFSATFIGLGRESEYIGSKSSKDEFFTVRYIWNEETKKKDKKIIRPVSEIDRGDVIKAAFSNLEANGYTRFLGIRNLSFDDLKEAGIDITKIQKITYGKPEMSEEAQKQKKEITAWLNEMCDNKQDIVKACLVKVTTFTGKDGTEVKGKSNIDDISENQIKNIHGKIKSEYEKWTKKEKENTGDGK